MATVVGGTLSAGSANALNCVVDADIDQLMRRTARRPLPRHQVGTRGALWFGLALGVVSTVWLWTLVNPLSSMLALALAGLPMKTLGTCLNELMTSGSVLPARPTAMVAPKTRTMGAGRSNDVRFACSRVTMTTTEAKASSRPMIVPGLPSV